MVPNGYTSKRPGPYWSNQPFFIFDIRALWRSGLSARAPKCQKYENGGLDQYGTEPFAQQRFGTSGVEGGECLHLLDRVYNT